MKDKVRVWRKQSKRLWVWEERGANEDECPRYGEVFKVEVVNEKRENAEHNGRGEKLASSDQVKGTGWV